MPRLPVRVPMFASFVGWIAFATAPALAEQVDYRGYQAVRVKVSSPQDLERIEAAGGKLLTCEPRPGAVDVYVPPGGMARLVEAGLSVKLVSADIGPAMTRHLNRAAGAGPFDDYMPLAGIEQYIRDLAAARPDLCSVSTIGFSVQNRPILVLHITGPTGGSKPGVFYHGLQHAREWITGPTVLYLANHLVTNYDTNPCIHDLVDSTNVYLAPCMNPDGYVYTWTNNRLWRKNRRNNGSSFGVDLNRNWGVGWGGEGSSGSPSQETYRGPLAFSEPETQAFRNFMQAHPDIRAHMDYHSFSQLILWPFGYTISEPAEPDRSVFYSLGYRMQQLIQGVHGEYYEPGPIYTTIYPASGGACDWAYGAEGIFGFSIELRPTESDDDQFELPPSEIIPTCEENLPAILHLTEWAANDLMLASSSSALSQLTSGQDSTVSVSVVESSGTVVAGSVKMYYRYAADAAFTQVVMTPAGGGLYAATLPATNCSAEPEVYFTAQSNGGQFVEHPCGAPTHVYSPTVVSSAGTFYSQPLNANPGWTMQGQWAWGTPTGGGGDFGNPDPTSGHTGTSVLGYNLNGDYPDNLGEQHLTSPAINCTGKSGVKLKFWRWLGVEQSIYDHAYVRVSTNGTTWTTIWQNAGTVADSTWVQQEFDISAIADNQATVYLRWTMGSTDGGWRFCGWNIDDIELSTGECTTLAGDWNGDAVVDLADFVAFPPCVLGPSDSVAPGCAIFDFNGDAHVDLDDVAAFERTAAP